MVEMENSVHAIARGGVSRMFRLQQPPARRAFCAALRLFLSPYAQRFLSLPLSAHNRCCADIALRCVALPAPTEHPAASRV